VKKRLVLVALMMSPVIIALVSVFFGSYRIDPLTVVSLLFNPEAVNGPEKTIIMDIRLPRLILAGISGAALSASGVVLQGIFHNPLADPFILGISAGAALGCAISVAFFPGIPIQIAAFLFGCLAVAIAYTMARATGAFSRLSLVLSGVVVSSFFTACLSVVKFLVDPYRLQSIVFWLMGSFSLADWQQVKIATVGVTAGMVPIYLMRWRLNVMSLGDMEAHSLGQHVEKERILFILFATFIVGITVSLSGIIGWVGIMIPHLLRLAIGPDHRVLVPTSCAGGAAFMILADTLARSMTSFDLPIGIITALVGAPFFFFLLTKTEGNSW